MTTGSADSRQPGPIWSNLRRFGATPLDQFLSPICVPTRGIARLVCGTHQHRSWSRLASRSDREYPANWMNLTPRTLFRWPRDLSFSVEAVAGATLAANPKCWRPITRFADQRFSGALGRARAAAPGPCPLVPASAKIVNRLGGYSKIILFESNGHLE
jgi:hypothetical protein